MRQVVIQEFVSLDGYAAGPNNSVDFIPASTSGDKIFGAEQVKLMDRFDTMLLGRTTYSMFAGFWPNITEGEQKEFADKFNGMPKIVFSTTLDSAPWGNWQPARIVDTDAADEVAKLKQQSGKDLFVSGSISIAQALVDRGLVDEFRLILCPVVLGGGLSFFREDQPLQLKLSATTPLSRGGVSLVYTK